MSCTQCQTPAASASRILLLSLLAPLGTPWVETKRPEVHSIPILIVRCNAEGQPLDSQQDHYPREGPQTAQYRLHGLQKPLWLELKRDASALAPSFSSFSFGHEGRGVAEGNKWENRKDGDNLEMERDNMEEDGELKKYMKIQSKMQLKENTPKVGERPDDEKMERQGEVEVDVDSKVSDTVHRNANVSIERKKDVGQATVTPTTMDLSKQPLDYFFKPRQLDPHLCLFSGSVRSCPVCPKIGHASVSICGALTGFISSQGQEMGIGPLSECAGQYRGPCAHRLTFAGDWESSDGGESVEDLLMSSRAKGNTEYKQQVSEDQLKNSTRHGLHQNTSSLSQEQSREEESTKVQQVVNHHEIKQSQKIPQKRKSSKRMIDYTKFGATFGTVESGNRFKSTWSQEIASGQGNDSKVKDIIDMKTTKKAEKSLAKSGENSRSNKILFLKSRSDARTTWDTARRAKRFVSRPRHLKVLLVIDDSMRQEYDVQAEAYVLTMGARAARVMADGSLESSLRMFITGITSLPGEEEDNSLIHGVGKGGRVGQLDGRIGGDGEGNSGDFDGNGDKVVMSGKEKTAKEYGISGKRRKESASMMLKSFCDWQKHLNEAYRHVQRHHDAAVLITRKNLCGSQDCETLGMAEVGTVCNPNRSCAVVEDDGVNTALAIAHELGHLLGLPHDESDQCQRLLSSAHVPTSFGVQGHVMGETLRSVSLDKPWSECSARHLMDFFDAGHVPGTVWKGMGALLANWISLRDALVHSRSRDGVRAGIMPKPWGPMGRWLVMWTKSCLSAQSLCPEIQTSTGTCDGWLGPLVGLGSMLSDLQRRCAGRTTHLYPSHASCRRRFLPRTATSNAIVQQETVSSWQRPLIPRGTVFRVQPTHSEPLGRPQNPERNAQLLDSQIHWCSSRRSLQAGVSGFWHELLRHS
uniref:uncharacterized protein isoform X2 n=1 Tax=Myxine glutinosa TaxID=7769 RepID=UPI0035902BFE